jgi:hypothetical protein
MGGISQVGNPIVVPDAVDVVYLLDWIAPRSHLPDNPMSKKMPSAPLDSDITVLPSRAGGLTCVFYALRGSPVRLITPEQNAGFGINVEARPELLQ